MADKAEVSFGEWGSGKYPKAKFPLSKAGRRAHALGSAWSWRFAEFEHAGEQFVLRLILNEGKAKASAHLALRTAKDCTVLCCLEYHVDHETGWHLHTLCGERNSVADAPTGTLVHGPWVKRIPDARQRHRRDELFKDMYGGAKACVWREVVGFFRLEMKGDLV
ncbi:hypothetical protein [Novosphingobium sp. fls2-241-R2A-195]|uniref:hypothetical protein n=1 Tax=Novosphingobium sp. fls2-241-R2A-195 TaxID=3040296 RepID=UPI00254D4B30|nr:hypothetical protein [Novosphingobium sp. fls2-241-R2A-195]